MKTSLMLGWVLFATASLVPAADSKFSKDLSNPPSAMVDVIVEYVAAPTANHHEKVLRRGGVLKADFGGIIKAAAYSLPASALSDLSEDPDVVYIAPDRPLKGMLNYTAAAVNAAAAWTQYNLDGTGIGVAVIDSGISNHPDLMNASAISRVVWGQDFAGGGTDDLYGHGTHVAGIIAGNGSLSTGKHFTMTFKGIAPNANLINLRALDANGNGTDSSVIHRSAER